MEVSPAFSLIQPSTTKVVPQLDAVLVPLLEEVVQSIQPALLDIVMLTFVKSTTPSVPTVPLLNGVLVTQLPLVLQESKLEEPSVPVLSVKILTQLELKLVVLDVLV